MQVNIPGAIFDLLKHPAIEVNTKSQLGSSPLMVAVEYCRKEALDVIIRDTRIDIETVDNQNRKLEEVVGELQELHKSEHIKLQESQEVESHQFIEKLERDLVAFLETQQEEQTIYLAKLKAEKMEFDQRQQAELER